ncbi:hypothetical protein RCS94_06110 [Orbaceae bacterium ac157xtp]
MIAQNSYGALSATSANTIQGNKPELIGREVAKKLGFKVGSTSYSEANDVYDVSTNPYKDKIESGTPKLFESNLRLNEFLVQGLTVNDFDARTDYYDEDGDEAATPAFTVGGLTYKWFDGNGAEIADENKMVGCSGFSQPLTLKINLVAQSHSEYGDPRHSDPTGLEQSYQIKASTSGFCFAKPNSLDWWSSAMPDPTRGGGYNVAQFDPANGFRAGLSPKFPTTGFVGAEFTLVMVGNVSDYTFTHNGGTAITLNTTTGKVTLNSKPSGAVTITATKNGTPHYYTFNPVLWMRPIGAGNYAWAKGQCGGESKIPRLAQLTSAPSGDRFTRAVGRGVFGEWGDTNSTNYPGSQWFLGYYWSRDAQSHRVQYVVHSRHGSVVWGDNGTSTSYYLACLE